MDRPAPQPKALDSGRSSAGDTREHITAVAAHLLETEGRDALTTRAVAAAAGVQQPTIYRLFSDKNGLLDAVAEHGFQNYIERKTLDEERRDALDALRTGWDLHVGFGLANPAIYSIMYGDPQPGQESPAARQAIAMLRERMQGLAAAGRLRVSEERATELMHASGCGTVFTLLATPEAERDLSLSTSTREAVIAAIATDVPVVETPGAATAATALRANLGQVEVLSANERQLLAEWLDRIAAPADHD